MACIEAQPYAATVIDIPFYSRACCLLIYITTRLGKKSFHKLLNNILLVFSGMKYASHNFTSG